MNETTAVVQALLIINLAERRNLNIYILINFPFPSLMPP